MPVGYFTITPYCCGISCLNCSDIMTCCTGGTFMVTHYAKNRTASMSYTATPIVRTSKHCLSFWYYFGGGPAGSLLVYITTAQDEDSSLVWSRDHVSSMSRLSWLPGSISLPAAVFPIREVPI